MPEPRVVIIGAGPAGIAMGIRLKRAGFDDFTIVERSSAVGGTWHDNHYPGAACDVPSHLYCFSFAPNPDWHNKFARQPEILSYFKACVDRYDLARHLLLDTEVAGAQFDEARGTWRVDTSAGVLEANAVVTAVGQLNRPHTPALPGIATFAGTRLHSARWDDAHDFTGRRVVVIGSGASAIQLVPEIAKIARQVTVMQRSPGYVVPRNDRVYRGWERWVFAHVPLVRRLYRSWIYGSLEARFGALRQGSWMAKLVRWIARRHLHAQIADPQLRARLTPDYAVGCKRLLISDDWYPALARDNVSLVTEPIARVVGDGVVTADGTTHTADTLVLATGFETTSFLAPMRVVGRGGAVLAEVWRGGAEALRGICVRGFPNLFMLYGPNTNLGHNSILFMLECQVRYVIGCLGALARHRARWLDVRPEAMTRWNDELQRALAETAWAAGCHSWYKTADGKITNNWSRRTATYWMHTRKPDLREYELCDHEPLELDAPSSGPRSSPVNEPSWPR